MMCAPYLSAYTAKDFNDSDESGARPLQPSNTIEIGIVDESWENELDLLVLYFGAAARMSMAREVVLTAYHHTDTSFEYLKMRTPKVLAVRDWPEVWLATQVDILPLGNSRYAGFELDAGGGGE